MSRTSRFERVRTEFETRGLIRRKRSKPTETAHLNGFGERLRESLPAVSPLFALFGRYLAGRTDCLALRDCRELDRIHIAAEPTPMARVGDFLSRSVGGPLDERFRSFDEPGRANLLHQWHTAELIDGTRVTVKLIRPEVSELLNSDLELLPVLEDLDLGFSAAPSLVEDFVTWLDRQLDLETEVVGLKRLAAEVGTFDAFRVPAVVDDLCSREVAVRHRVGGTRLGELIGRGGNHRPTLARHICQAWLQQTLIEGTCPEGPLADHLEALTDETFAITGGLFTTLDPEERRHFSDAVVATARHDPDRACEAMLAECTKLDGAVDTGRVLSELRQAETFRSGGWTDRYSGRHIADGFFIYWRLLTRMGYRPRSHAVALVHGFSQLEAAARMLAPETDVMADAIDDFRVVAAAVSVRKLIGPRNLIRVVEELAPVIGEVLEDPKRLSRRSPRATVENEANNRSEPRRGVSWQTFAGAMAVLAAVTILGVTLIRSNPGQNWVEWLVVLGVVVTVGGVFRLIGGHSTG